MSGPLSAEMLCFQNCLPSLYRLLYLVDVCISGVSNCHFVFHTWYEKVDLRFKFMVLVQRESPGCLSVPRQLAKADYMQLTQGFWERGPLIKPGTGERLHRTQGNVPSKGEDEISLLLLFLFTCQPFVVMQCSVISQLQICDILCPNHCRGHSSTRWTEF